MLSELRTRHLFTPERLFGEFATSGLSRHAVFLERAKAEAERNETAVRLALAAYLVVRLVDTYLFADQNDPGEREGLLWQLGAVRRHVGELPTDAAESNHLSGVVDAVPFGSDSVNTLRVSLMAYAYFLEHEGRFAEALEILALAVRTHGAEVPATDFAACARFAARLNRLLARWEQALGCFEAARDAALSTGDQATAYRARLGCGAVFRGQGNLPLALKIAEEVLKEVTEQELTEVQAIAYADLGGVYPLLGRPVEGLQALYKAFMLAPDPVTRMNSLGDLGIGLLGIGAHAAARVALNIVVNSKAEFRIRTNALVELMDLESIVGDRIAFERCRALAEACRDRMPPSMTADYLYKTGTGLARFGQVGRGRENLTAALEFAEANKLNTWYFKIEQALRDLETLQEQKQTEQPVERSWAPAVEEMEMGLREYAALQLA